jgi:hypothetical protein
MLASVVKWPMRRSSLLACALALLVASPSAAAEPGDTNTAAARVLGEEGFDALDAKDYPKALDLFTRAEELHHAPTLLVGRARALRGLGRLVEARESYQRALRDPLVPDASDAFRQAIEDAKTEVAEVDKQIAWVTIRVTGPGDAQVLVDGEPVPRAALGAPRATDPGEHQAVLRAPRCSDKVQAFRAAPGERQELALDLPPTGCVSTEPSPSEPAGDAAGSGAMRTAGFVTLGVGGAFLVVGVVTGIVAMSAHSTLVDACPEERCPESEQGTLDRYALTHPMATTGFIVGGVLLATGLTLVLVAPSSEGSETAATALGSPGTMGGPARISLRLGAAGLGLAVTY